jgi:glycosyltransferase involved in cell wall biosynthesis
MDTAPPPLRVSVIATVRNEEESIGRVLDGLAGQTRPADEIVIVDGGSEDGTLALLEQRSARRDLPLTVISRPGANISAGRNAAIAAACGPIIAVTDAGVRLDPAWLATLSAPFADGAGVVAGFFRADPEGAFETALGATTLPVLADIEPQRFLPSSRSVAFRKDAWAAVGGYPEWLDYCEDLVFDIRILEAAGPATFAPDAVALFRPRRTLAAFLAQYYRYARGDGKADLWRRRHLVRYATYLGAGPLLVVAALRHPAWWLILLAGFGAMLATPYRRLRGQWGALSQRERLLAVLWVPAIRVSGDLAKMAGYPAGLAWRHRRRPPPWRPAARPVTPMGEGG